MAKQKARPELATTPTGEYTVVARRYRPQQFADLVGQEPVARALTNAITSDRVAHAYLFTGARGTGKTSTARILAKALNCEKGPTPTPCDQCEVCQSIASGEDIDVLEIDGASNRGIDEVRAIRQNVGTRPARSRFKIYIIDEVHMLTPPAFNALLKTLEEPPAHVKFIFATTEVQKIPITILSRCQRFDFAGIPVAKIAARLKQVVAAEKMEADEAALLLVARRAGGSMRDAQSLLDQLLAFGGGRLTVEKVHQLLGTATDERIFGLVDAIVSKDAKQAFDLIGSYAEEGLQLGELLDQLIEYWRCLMLLNCAGAESADAGLTEAAREKAVQVAQSLPLDSILAGLDILTTAKGRLRGSSHAHVVIEMAVLRLIRLEELVPIAQLIHTLGQQGQATVESSVASRSATAPSAAAVEAAKKNAISERTGLANGQKPSVFDLQPASLAEVWGRVCEELGPILGSYAKVAGLPAILGPNSLVLRFEARYTSQYDHCSASGSVQRMQEAMKSITGSDWQVRVELTRVDPQARGANTTEDHGSKTITSRERTQELLKIPLLGRAAEKLDARLLKMDAAFGSVPDEPSEKEDGETEE
jgi:DNA polymerase-3 subunit gamma/tau